MTDKTLRILVADKQHFQRLKIEKILNQLGYFRVAPIQSFDEIKALTRFSAKPFDLLIINKAIAAETGVDLDEFCRDNPLIRHALIYDGQEIQLPAMSDPAPSAVQINLAGTPESESLKGLMELIDPRARENTLKVLPWLRELSQRPAN